MVYYKNILDIFSFNFFYYVHIITQLLITCKKINIFFHSYSKKNTNSDTKKAKNVERSAIHLYECSIFFEKIYENFPYFAICHTNIWRMFCKENKQKCEKPSLSQKFFFGKQGFVNVLFFVCHTRALNVKQQFTVCRERPCFFIYQHFQTIGRLSQFFHGFEYIITIEDRLRFAVTFQHTGLFCHFC